MAKEFEDLAESRKTREKIIKKYGFVPQSVIDIKYSKKLVDEYEEDKQLAVVDRLNKKRVKIGDGAKMLQNKGFLVSGKNIRGKSAGVSTFPSELALFILKFYSNEGDLVLDPCCGHNSRMEITNKAGRSYIGYDISEKYMKHNRRIRDRLLDEHTLIKSDCSITFHEQSSEKMEENDETVDLVYTSPPYWDLEYYGEEPEQLGFGKSYPEFLEGLQRVINEAFRVLKHGKYCVFNVNDFRKKNQFYPYHADVLRLFENAGFKLWDVVIVKWANSIGQIFASQVEDRKITAKLHEYLIVGKKV